MKASVNFERLSLHSLKSYLKDAQVEINVEIELDPYMTPDEIIATGKLKQLRNRARSWSMVEWQWNLPILITVIIVEMGMDLHSSKAFMIAALRSHMKTSEYVFIIPWLAHVSFFGE